MGLGFAVIAHDDPRLLGILVRVLAPYPVVVHLDAKVDQVDFEAEALLAETENASYCPTRVRVEWGAWSSVEAMGLAASVLLPKLADTDYLVFLSGKCLPVRPVGMLASYLADHYPRPFCRAFRLQDGTKWDRDRVRKQHFFGSRMLGRRWRRVDSVRRLLRRAATMIAPRVRIPASIDIAVGSQWMALPRGCAADAVRTINDPTFVDLFGNSFAPDEMAIQTHVRNSRWGSELPYENGKSVSELPNLHQLDSQLLGTIDAGRVLAPAGHEFFARKFSSERDAALIASLLVKLDVQEDIT